MSDLGVVRIQDSFEAVPFRGTNSPAMLHQLTQSQTGTTVVSNQQRLTEDDNAFAEAQNEGTMEAMQRYLASYSNEIHADEANIILVDLYDDLAYAQTKEEGTILSLARYLIQFPDGKYSNEANAEFEKMQEYIAFAKENLSKTWSFSPTQVRPEFRMALNTSMGRYDISGIRVARELTS